MTSYLNDELLNFQAGTWNLKYKNRYRGISYNFGYTFTNSSDKRKIYFNLSKKFFNSLLISLNLSDELNQDDKRASLAFKYVTDNNFFLSSKLYYYDDLKKQLGHEGDYAYSFGYMMKKPKITFKYSNYYMKTRFPWREERGVGFIDGSVSLTYGFKF